MGSTQVLDSLVGAAVSSYPIQYHQACASAILREPKTSSLRDRGNNEYKVKMRDEPVETKKRLRRRAEELVAEAQATDPLLLDNLPLEDIREIIHELHVRQMELRLQNDELRRVQLDVEHSRDNYSDQLAKAERLLRQRNREMATHNKITTAVAGSLELSEVLLTVQKLLSEQLLIPGGGIFLLNGDQDQLELKAGWGLPAPLSAEFQLRSVAEAHEQRAIREKEILFWPDFREVRQLALALDRKRPQWQSHLCIPLLAQDEVQGVLNLFSRAPLVFSVKQIAFFKTLGQQIGVAVQNARLFEEVRRGHERLRQLAQRVVSVQEDERRRVSRELHDEAGQALTVLKFTLQQLLSQLTEASDEPFEPETFTMQLQEAIGLCDRTMNDIRLLAHDLRPAALDDLGLNPTLEGYCRDFDQRMALRISYNGEEPPLLPASVGICLYRFLQEALTNVVKHAQADKVEVNLRCDANTVSLSVEDNGRGFDRHAEQTAPSRDKGVGLLGMQERLDAVGGWLAIDSRPGEGSCLVAYIPLPE